MSVVDKRAYAVLGLLLVAIVASFLAGGACAHHPRAFPEQTVVTS